MISYQPPQIPTFPTVCLSETSKSNILRWLSSIIKYLPENFLLEELTKGNVYCQILNFYSPGIIPDAQINHKPKNSSEMISNFRLVQNALFQLKINIPFDANKIINKKSQQNLHLIHYLYQLFSSSLPQQTSLNSPRLFPSSIHHQYYLQNSPFSQASNSDFQELQEKPFWPQKMISTPYSMNSGENAMRMYHYFQEGVKIPKIKSGRVKRVDKFKRNLNATLDRIKEILLKDSYDGEKVKQLKMLLGQETQVEIIEIEDDEVSSNVSHLNHKKNEEDDDEKNSDRKSRGSKRRKDEEKALKQKKPFRI